MNAWQFISSHRAEVLAATREHIVLVLISMAVAVMIGVPLGLSMVSRPRLRAVALAVASILQTVPSLALFGFLIPLPFLGGIGPHTAIVALVLYALLPILRNTYVGLTCVDPAILEAAEGMGMTENQILFRVRLPILNVQIRSNFDDYVAPAGSRVEPISGNARFGRVRPDRR